MGVYEQHIFYDYVNYKKKKRSAFSRYTITHEYRIIRLFCRYVVFMLLFYYYIIFNVLANA